MFTGADMISCYPLDTALPLEDLEAQHRQNEQLLEQCFLQRAMLASQREMLANQRMAALRFTGPNAKYSRNITGS
jgi:hypothetical protein